MSQQITAVVFDLGGVLLDWNPRHLYRRLFADPGEMEDFLARICTPDWHSAHDLGEDITQSCRRLARQHPRHRDMIMAWVDPGDEMAAGQLDEAVGVLAEDWKHHYERAEAAYPLPGDRRAKYWPPVRRIDSAYGDRHLVCACPPPEAFE